MTRVDLPTPMDPAISRNWSGPEYSLVAESSHAEIRWTSAARPSNMDILSQQGVLYSISDVVRTYS